jgi:hypothetical protein
MRTLFFLLISLVIIPLQTRAQVTIPESIEQSCGSDEHHAYLMKSDPAYKTRHLQQKAVLDSIKRAPHAQVRQQPMVYTIPVVVHVIHLGEQIGSQSNISDKQIHDALTGLNERYANVNGAGTDIEINFCLANRDPNGCPTSGINRVDGSIIPGYAEEGITWAGDCGVDEVLVKDLSKWPTWEYYNIWVVHDICGSIAGYAYYPNGNEYDGTVIDIFSIKYESGVLAHEIGHGLNLKHTFSGDDDDNCPDNEDCLEDGDEICDTPPHRSNDCGTNNPCSTEGVWLNSKYNWMSYCFPSFEIGRFTEDQRTRMQDALSVEPRVALLSSIACSNEFNMEITSDGSILCPNEERVLTAVPEGGYYVIASGSGYIQGNILIATGGTEIVVEYKIDQEDCSSSVYQAIKVKPIPNSLLRSAEDTLCIGQTTTLQGFPSGGTYAVISGPGAIDSNLLIAEDAGMIALLYEKMQSGCFIRDTHVVESFALPVADIAPITEDVLTAVPDTGTFQWVRCDLDYEAVPNATDAVYQVASSGSYAVVSVNGICRDTSDCIDVELTSTHDEKPIDHFRIYPNPVKDVFYLDGYFNPNEVEVTLLDMRGLPLNVNINLEQNRIEFDLSAQLAGVYILQVDVKGGGRIVYRVVKI